MKLDCVPKDFVQLRFVLAIFAIRSEMEYSRFSVIHFISPQRSNAEQNPLVRTFIIPCPYARARACAFYHMIKEEELARARAFTQHNTSNNTSTKLQLQLIKLHIEIVNLKPVTPTTILLQNLSALRERRPVWRARGCSQDFANSKIKDFSLY